MNYFKTHKIIALFLAVLMILPLIPAVDLTVFAEGTMAVTTESLQDDIGRKATPAYDYFVSYIDHAFGENIFPHENKDYSSDIEFVITDVYVNSSDNAVFYKVELINGEMYNHNLNDYPWIFQCYMNDSTSSDMIVLGDKYVPDSPVIPDNVKDLYDQLMATELLKDYEAIMETVDADLWAAIEDTSMGAEIIEHSYLLIYDHYYSTVSEAEYNAVKEKYPDAYNYIQADAELKYFNDLILERVKYLDQHPEERYMQFGEIEYVELPSYTNVAPLVSPTVQVKQPRSAIGAPFAYLRTAANNARAAEDNGVFLSKWATYDSLNKNYKVRLEAYTTGSKVTTVTKTEKPVDIVLVLDLSSSMTSGRMDAVGYQQITGGTALQGADLADSENLFVMVDGEYREVTVTGSGTTTTTSEKQYSGTRTFNAIQSYIDSGKKLYCKHNDGSYCEIECYIKNNGNNRYTIRCAHGDQVGAYRGNSSNVNLTLYESIPGVTYEKYEYSYEGENGQTVSITYNTNDSIVGGDNPEYYTTYANGQISRAEALINAITNFTNQVAKKAAGKDGDITTKDDNVNHTIAIVGYNTAGSSTTGIYTGSQVNIWSNTNSITQAEYAAALQAMNTQTGVDNIKASIEKLKTSNASGTNTFAGVSMAHSILQANPQAGDPDRNQVVVIFTDGQPYGSQTINGTTYSPENAGIYHAKQIKDMGATVYSVGILDGGNAAIPPSGSINIFMHGMSSNYKNATSTSNLGELTNDRYYEDGSNYYLLASNADDLNNIFTSISQSATTGGSITNLSTSTQIRDIISPYFKLPDGANTDHIKLYTADYLKENTFGGLVPFAGSVTISADGKTIGVTGFDYAENWVGTETDADGKVTFHGKKLIIEFTIVPDPLFLGGTGVATNGADSGIYPDSSSSEVIENFNVPTVDVPLKSIDTVAKDRHIYWSNSVDLTDILNLHVTETSSEMLLQDIANGVNNAFVDLVYYVKLADDTRATYTIPAGTLWNAGTWSYPTGTLDMKALILDANTSYGIECVMTDIKDSTKQMRAPASGTSLATVYVYKPVLTFKDSEQTYRKPLNPTSSSIDEFINSHWESIVWKRADGTKSTDVTMSGSTPQVGIVYQYDTTAFTADLKMNSVRDVPVNVTVTITGTGKVVTITQGDAFQHSDCSHPECAFNPATEEFIVHVIGALTSLKIQKVTKNKNGVIDSFENIDPNQTFLFRVMGKDADGNDINVTVTVHAKDGSTIVDGLVIGNQYTVQELTDWSWRYTCELGAYTNSDDAKTENTFIKDTATLTITSLGEEDNVATFENTRNTEYWLDGDSWCDNRFMANVTQAIN